MNRQAKVRTWSPVQTMLLGQRAPERAAPAHGRRNPERPRDAAPGPPLRPESGHHLRLAVRHRRHPAFCPEQQAGRLPGLEPERLPERQLRRRRRANSASPSGMSSRAMSLAPSNRSLASRPSWANSPPTSACPRSRPSAIPARSPSWNKNSPSSRVTLEKRRDNWGTTVPQTPPLRGTAKSSYEHRNQTMTT